MTSSNPSPRPEIVIPALELPPPAQATESDMTSSNSNQNVEDATSTLEPTSTPQNVTSQPAQFSLSAPTLSRAMLKRIARENKICLPQIVDKNYRLEVDSSEAIVYADDPFRALPHVKMPDQSKCPKFEALSPACGTRILVEDIDSLEAAIVIATLEGRDRQNSDTTIAEQTQLYNDIAFHFDLDLDQKMKTPVLILNCACDESPGGDWIDGGRGQEEALFYRTSLSRSLHQKHYPLISDTAMYSPKVFVMRESARKRYVPLFGENVASLREEDPHNSHNDESEFIANTELDHDTQDSAPQDPSTLGMDPEDFQVFSVVSISPVRNPALSDRSYVAGADVSAMLERMRIVLRIAASQGHTRLVLAALGCGRAHHPPELVAKMWLKVFREEEFTGGWWEYVVFAVKDKGEVFQEFQKRLLRQLV